LEACLGCGQAQLHAGQPDRAATSVISQAIGVEGPTGVGAPRWRGLGFALCDGRFR
jgi:hypothetical protein